jgi:hypothetical protein
MYEALHCYFLLVVGCKHSNVSVESEHRHTPIYAISDLQNFPKYDNEEILKVLKHMPNVSSHK